jgi:ABC-type glycerol-3-phosphate transport system permease component
MLDTVWGLMLPYLASGTAFYLFKLCFDGRREHVDKAVQQGTPALNAVLNQAVLPSLPILLLIAATFSFAAVAVNGLPWMLVATHSLETAPWPAFMLRQSSAPSVQPEWLGILALRWVGTLFAIWVVPALLAQLFLVDQLALVGKPHSTKEQ